MHYLKQKGMIRFICYIRSSYLRMSLMILLYIHILDFSLNNLSKILLSIFLSRMLDFIYNQVHVSIICLVTWKFDFLQHFSRLSLYVTITKLWHLTCNCLNCSVTRCGTLFERDRQITL